MTAREELFVLMLLGICAARPRNQCLEVGP